MSFVFVTTRNREEDIGSPFTVAYSAFASVWVCFAVSGYVLHTFFPGPYMDRSLERQSAADELLTRSFLPQGMYPTTILLLASLRCTLSDMKLDIITTSETLPAYATHLDPATELRRGTSYRLQRLTVQPSQERGSMSTCTCLCSEMGDDGTERERERKGERVGVAEV